MPIKQIVEITGLSEEKIETLEKQIKNSLKPLILWQKLGII